MLYNAVNSNFAEARVFYEPDRGTAARAQRRSKTTISDLINFLENEDVEGFNAARKSFRGKIDLSGLQSLSGKNLTGVDFTSVILNNANLTNTILDGAFCRDAHFVGATMDGISAIDADFTNAKMQRVSLKKGKHAANLQGAVFTSANLARATLDYADFSGANLEGAILVQAGGTTVNFEGANLIEADFRLTMLDEKASFKGAYIRDLKHNNFGAKKTLLTGAIADQDPPPGMFKTSAPESFETKLISGIIGTDRERFEDALAKLEELIGLTSVKKLVYQLLSSVEMEQYEARHGLPEIKLNQHYAFTGRPGTAKTTVARYFGELLHALGYLEKGHLVEVDRSGLVAGFKGQTALKTREVIESALGGILFIDEAYTLVQNDEDTFGIEARDTILKAMEDYSGQLVVIFAGYPDQMEKFINGNPGLKSRVSDFVNFESYDTGELTDIYKLMLGKGARIYDPEFIAYASILFGIEHSKNSPDFGNGRFVRNIFTDTILNQRARNAALLKSRGEDARLSKDELGTLSLEDLPFEQIIGRKPESIALEQVRWLDNDQNILTWKELSADLSPFPIIDPQSLKDALKEA